jgi:hypothetical protein
VESAPSHYVDWERCMKKKRKGNQRNEINQPKKGEERGEKKKTISLQTEYYFIFIIRVHIYLDIISKIIIN